MTTGNFAEIFKNNMNDAIKLFQDTGAAVLEAQTKQIEFAGNFLKMDTLQKNFESILNFSKVAFNNALEYGKQANVNTFPKEMIDTIIESMNQQAENIRAFNQTYLDALTNQINSAKHLFDSSLTEKFKKDFDTNMASLKEMLKTITDNYSKLVDPSFETNKEFFHTLHERMDEAVNSNLKLWSEILSAYKANTAGSENNNSNSKNSNPGSERKTQFRKETMEN